MCTFVWVDNIGLPNKASKLEEGILSFSREVTEDEILEHLYCLSDEGVLWFDYRDGNCCLIERTGDKVFTLLGNYPGDTFQMSLDVINPTIYKFMWI